MSRYTWYYRVRIGKIEYWERPWNQKWTRGGILKAMLEFLDKHPDLGPLLLVDKKTGDNIYLTTKSLV